MTDAWDEIQAIKSKRNILREKLEKRKKERQDILGTSTLLPAVGSPKQESIDEKKSLASIIKTETDVDPDIEKSLIQILADSSLILPINSKQLTDKLLKILLRTITNDSLHFFLKKLASQGLISVKDVSIGNEVGYEVILVEPSKLSDLYNELSGDTELGTATIKNEENLKRKLDPDSSDESSTNGAKMVKPTTTVEKKSSSKEIVCQNTTDIMSLLSMPSTREKQSKQVGEEILELLSKPTAKERSLAEKFKSQGGAQVMEFCPHGTRAECLRQQVTNDEEIVDVKGSIPIAAVVVTPPERIIKKEVIESITDEDIVEEVDDIDVKPIVENLKPNQSLKLIADVPQSTPPIKDKCNKLHFKKIIQSHTDESLGDCSFLNTCFHMDTCKYVHYEVDSPQSGQNQNSLKNEGEKLAVGQVASVTKRTNDPAATLYPPQWIQCDLRYLDMTILGKFAVVMADPPWDIHMELPYGTMSDDEMRQLGVPALQDDGLIFLWVTGRAMELGRECLKLWGYERVDELIWVKTNQLQRIIRTGRTGHWLNHGKEHCLVGMKGNPPNLNRGLDCDVIVAEVRATSHKPDEIYGIIERLSPGTRKIELFGRPHNVQPNWITLGNQLDGIRLVDPDLISSFQKRYPDGNCMAPSTKVT